MILKNTYMHDEDDFSTFWKWTLFYLQLFEQFPRRWPKYARIYKKKILLKGNITCYHCIYSATAYL